MKEADRCFARHGEAYVFLGLLFRGCVVVPAEKTCVRLTELRDDIARGEARLGDLQSGAGRLVWAARVTQRRLDSRLVALRALRRATNAAAKARDLSTIYTFSRDERKDLLLMINSALTPNYISEPKESERFSVSFSDASDAGWGVVLCGPGGEYRSYGGRWPEGLCDRHIVTKEALALLFGVVDLLEAERFLGWRRPCSRVIYCDATAVVGALRRGRSPSAELDDIVLRARLLLQRDGIPWVVRYVRSQDNPADLPSRVFED